MTEKIFQTQSIEDYATIEAHCAEVLRRFGLVLGRKLYLNFNILRGGGDV